MQWVRIEGRSPGTHKLPSRAVEALWRALRPNERDWETFCNSLDMKLDAGLDALTHWVPDDDSEPMRATWSDAFDDEVPFTGYPTLFIVDGEVGIADPATDLPDPDPAPSFRGLRGSLGRPSEPRHLHHLSVPGELVLRSRRGVLCTVESPDHPTTGSVRHSGR